jgi:hypothetical protein
VEELTSVEISLREHPETFYQWLNILENREREGWWPTKFDEQDDGTVHVLWVREQEARE